MAAAGSLSFDLQVYVKQQLSSGWINCLAVCCLPCSILSPNFDGDLKLSYTDYHMVT